MPYGQSKPLANNVTLSTLKKLKRDGEKFPCVALYDAQMAALAEEVGVETVLVGDSLGMTVLGFDSTVPVTLEHMEHHVAAVARGTRKCLIIADMPFMSYSTPDQASASAARLMRAGAHMVKLEGGAWLRDTVAGLTTQGIPVCAHLGLTPQSVNKLGGYRVQGKSDDQAKQILTDAQTLDAAGADLVVLECVPSQLAATITQEVAMSTIGIGAGPSTDAQVLVVNDLLGMTAKPPKFAKNYLAAADSIAAAMAEFAEETRSGRFPAPEHCFN
jgi:3-methyl-2-oxobutanoate hydroxymethyltransferase